METREAAPYRRTGASPEREQRPAPVDLEIVVLLAVLAPAFLAVVVHAIARGQALGAGPTVCGALVIAAAVGVITALRR